MVPDYWTVLGRLSCPILTLPGELNLRDEAVGILVLAHHAIFLQRHEEEKMRRLGDEAGVPRGLIEGETETAGMAKSTQARFMHQSPTCWQNGNFFMVT
jgi:hypothetical protein